MPGHPRRRIATAAALTAATVVSAALGNETVLPTVAIGALLAWQPPAPRRSTRAERAGAECAGTGRSERSAQQAVVAYSLFMAALSLLVSLFLPALARVFGLTDAFDGDFVRVTTNDVHEFGYATCLLLGLRLGAAWMHDRAGGGRILVRPTTRRVTI